MSLHPPQSINQLIENFILLRISSLQSQQIYLRSFCFFVVTVYSGAPAALRQGRQAEPHTHIGNRIMASGIARGRVRTTTTVESRKMAAILQIIGWQRHAALVYRVLF